MVCAPEAPSILASGVENASTATRKIMPVMTLAQKQKEDTFRIFFSEPMAASLEMMVSPPVPYREPKAIKNMKIGAAMVTALTM
jgi:hypothetical protein